jgi:uncharacterized protein YqiB (DUF1249 family)
MADRDWDRKTFFAYKAIPWVNRHFTPADSANDATPENDALAWYMATAREVLNHFSELQRLLAENDVDQAEIVMQSVSERARRLYDLGVALRARTPKLNVEDFAILDRVYEAVARILNEKQGNVFTVAEAIGNAEKHLDVGRVAHDNMA